MHRHMHRIAGRGMAAETSEASRLWGNELIQTRNQFTVAWDQSMFFLEMVRGVLDMDLQSWNADFHYPPQVRLIHQAYQ